MSYQSSYCNFVSFGRRFWQTKAQIVYTKGDRNVCYLYINSLIRYYSMYYYASRLQVKSWSILLYLPCFFQGYTSSIFDGYNESVWK